MNNNFQEQDKSTVRKGAIARAATEPVNVAGASARAEDTFT